MHDSDPVEEFIFKWKTKQKQNWNPQVQGQISHFLKITFIAV